jgi:hypothetical protein
MKNCVLFFILSITNIFVAQEFSAFMPNCKFEGVGSRVQNRIIEKVFVNDSIQLKLGIVANCAVDSSYKFHISQKKNALQFSIDSKNVFTSCSCYFEVYFSVKSNDPDSINVFYRDIELITSKDYFRRVDPVYKVYKKDTINRFDAFGFQQGLHISFENNIPRCVFYYISNSPVWDACLTRKGKLKEFCYYSVDNKFLQNISLKELNAFLRKEYPKLKKVRKNLKRMIK